MRIFLLSWILLATFSGSALADEGRVPMPSITKGRGDMCVEPTPVMRREHMNFLLAQRDQTMRLGIRGGKHSLAGCVECHQSRDEQGKPIPVNAPGQFCAECHRFAAVELDCFGCHASTSGDAEP